MLLFVCLLVGLCWDIFCCCFGRGLGFFFLFCFVLFFDHKLFLVILGQQKHRKEISTLSEILCGIHNILLSV